MLFSKYFPFISLWYTVPLFFSVSHTDKNTHADTGANGVKFYFECQSLLSEQHLDSFQQEWNRAMISFTGNTCVNPPNSGQTGCCENGLDRYCSYGYLAKYHVLNSWTVVKPWPVILLDLVLSSRQFHWNQSFVWQCHKVQLNDEVSGGGLAEN